MFKGYHGSVSSRNYRDIWNKELEENRGAFKTNVLKIFNSKQDALDYEYYLQKYFKVDKNPLYCNAAITAEFSYENYRYVKKKRKPKAEEAIEHVESMILKDGCANNGFLNFIMQNANIIC